MFVDAFEARWIGHAVRRHGPVVILITLIMAMIGYGFNLFSRPNYRAEALLTVSRVKLKFDPDSMQLRVSLVKPRRHEVEKICQSDTAIIMLAARLEGVNISTWASDQELEEKLAQYRSTDSLTRSVRLLRNKVYFDQLGVGTAALRAFDTDSQEAALIANTWAEISRDLLLRFYGTAPEVLQTIEDRIAEEKIDVLAASKAMEGIDAGADITRRLELSNNLDQARQMLTAENKRLADLKVRIEGNETAIKIGVPAVPPVETSNPSVGFITGLFALAGLLLGFSLALLRGSGNMTKGIDAGE